MTQDNDRIQKKIYDDLMRTENVYFTSEQIFPNWESIYVLIVSGFLIVYFTARTLEYPEKLVLCCLGFLLSFNWLQIVCRNHLFSKIRVKLMKELEEALREEIVIEKPKGKKALTLFSLYARQKQEIDKERRLLYKIDSWSLRKLLPAVLLGVWLLLVTWTLFCWL